MGNEIRNLAIVLAIFGFGWWLLNRQAQEQIPTPTTPTPTSTPAPTTPLPNTPFARQNPLLARKYNLFSTRCSNIGPLTPARLIASKGKATCIKVGSKHGVIVEYSGCRTTLGCKTFNSLPAADKKKLGADGCKCTVSDVTELEAELVKSSYTSFRVTIA